MQDFNFNYNVLGNVEKPRLILGNPAQSKIGELVNVEYKGNDYYYNNISTLQFNYYKYVDGELSPFYEQIDNNMTILQVGISWFRVSVCNKCGAGGRNEYKEIECESLECEFCDKRVTSFGSLGTSEDWDGGLDLYKLYDSTNVDQSIMHIVLNELPAWSIGTIDSNIKNSYRSFSVDDTDAYTFLTEDVAETYECVFLFDTFNRTVSAYSLESLKNYTNIILSYRNLINNVNFTSNSSDIKTRLVVHGGDDRGNGNLDIIEVNGGSNILENYSYFINKMSTGLQEHYSAYQTAVDNNSDKLNKSLLELIDLQNELYELEYANPSNPANKEDWTQYGLTALEEFLQEYETILSNCLADSVLYETNKAKYDAIVTEYNSKVSQIKTKEQEISVKLEYCKSLVVSVKDYVTDDEYKELSRLAYDDTFIDSSFIATTIMSDAEITEMKIELKELAKNKLDAICKPQYELEVDAVNFINMPEFKNYSDQLALGSIITIDYDEDGNGKNYVQGRLLGVHINWDNLSDFSLTFSNKNSLDNNFALDELQEQASSTANSLSITSSSFSNIMHTTNSVREFINSSLDASKNEIVSSANQDVKIGEYGIRIRKWDADRNDYDPKQIWMANGLITFSKDGYNTVQMALGEIELNGEKLYGIVADALIGKILIGEQLYIENDDATLKFNNNGLLITNNINSVEINPNSDVLFSILKNDDKILYFDSNGNGHFTGILDSAGGVFSGKIEVSNGVNSVVINPDNSNIFNIKKGSSNVLYFDSNGNGNYSGNISASSISGGTIDGSTISGSTFTATNYDFSPYGYYSMAELDGQKMSFSLLSLTDGSIVGKTVLDGNGVSFNNGGYIGENALYIKTNSDAKNLLYDGSQFSLGTTGDTEFICSNFYVYSTSADFTNSSYVDLPSNIRVNGTDITTRHIYGAVDDGCVAFRNASGGYTYATGKNYVASNYLSKSSTTADITASTGSGAIRFSNANAAGYDWVNTYFARKSDLPKTTSTDDSDIRLKDNIKDLLNVESVYMQFEPKTYRFIDGRTDTEHSGLIADSVEKICPELVGEANNNEEQEKLCSGGTHKTVKYNDLHAFHIAMIQKQQKEIEELQKEVKKLTEIIKNKLN